MTQYKMTTATDSFDPFSSLLTHFYEPSERRGTATETTQLFSCQCIRRHPL